jgi:flagellar biosynthesis/type III secretory pathway protein FliH
MVAEQDAGVGQAMAVLMELSEDERTRLLADSREKFLWDQWGREKHQYTMGLEAGREEGLAQGTERGLEAGLEKGRQMGLEETAKRLKAMGLPIGQTAAATGLDPKVIEAL